MHPYHKPDFVPLLLPQHYDPAPATRMTLAGVVAGVDGVLVAELASRHLASRPIIHIAINDAGLEAMHTALIALGVKQECIKPFPAWDCLPYDRTPPDASLVGRRIDCLTRLSTATKHGGAQPHIILTTVNAWLQRVPVLDYFATAHWRLAKGETMPRTTFVNYAESHAYRPTTTVREAGEYAIRGNLLDVFPPAASMPVRLDLFGDNIDSIKAFDPDTQQSHTPLTDITLTPASELPLDKTSIIRFRRQYIDAFGGQASQDWLYECTTQGLRPAGLDQYLPLFYDKLAHISDYLKEAIVVVSDEAEMAIEERFEQINDFYSARRSRTQEKTQTQKQNNGTDEDAQILRPLPPHALYLTPEEHTQLFREMPVVAYGQFQPTTPQVKHEVSKPVQVIEIQAKKGLAIYDSKHRTTLKTPTAKDSTAKQTSSNSIAALAHVIQNYKSKNKSNKKDNPTTIILTANSTGSLHRLLKRLSEYISTTDTTHTTISQDIIHASNLAQCKTGRINGIVWQNGPGFVLGDLVVISEADIYGSHGRAPRGKRRAEGFLREVSSISPGDLVVHADHGIGRYDGLHTLTIQEAAHDCLKLIYADGDRLYVPVENIDILSRYGGVGIGGAGGDSDSDHPLDRLGSSHWQARKARIKGRIRDIANALIKTAAMRATTQVASTVPDPASYSEFCRHFPYAETDDQLQAIADVLGDMASGHAMDRLVCGDVGFGKTEVALRASFASVMAGYQVAIVTPTTLLARQHAQLFTSRFAGFGIAVKTLSRMTSIKEATAIKKSLTSGACHIVIGTHAVLAKSLQFKNLGLVVIDEEQRFGVAQKERLKELRGDVHVLTLTATPIPRTLQMALAGVRDMSIIATPPVDRLAIRTWVGAWDGVVLANAIRYETHRGGQIFCVSPRIDYLPRVYERLRTLAPNARIITAHGKLSAAELDTAMQNFADGEADILLATNIIEAGIDIQRANTMIIHRADLFGLGQLYQLRGRIGRSKQRAHAYLTTEGMASLTADARRRFSVMQTLDSLGAGFSLASYDLDMRGGGNLLGDEQSGHIQEVGVELYQSMLAVAVKQAKKAQKTQTPSATHTDATTHTDDEDINPLIHLGAPVLIPESYVEDLSVRLSLYRRIAAIKSQDEQDGLAAELIDRFGALPEEVHNLMEVMVIKLLCRQCRVERLDAGPKGISIQFKDNRFPNPEGLFALVAEASNGMSVTNNSKSGQKQSQKLVITKTIPKSKRIFEAKQAMEVLAGLVV